MTNDTETFNLKLLANFIHQVVNPLNGASGIITNVVDGVTPDNRKEKRLKQCSEQIIQCIALIKNLAFFAEGFTKILESEKTDVVVPRLLIDAINFFQESASNKSVKIELKNSKDQYKMRAHLELSKQVFINLLDNAVKYCNSGTEITLQTALVNRGRYVAVVVESIGPQISHTEVEKIFGIGFRGENAKSALASGTGLGLHICKEIVETCHDGKILCESSSSGVTKFTVKFPAV